MIIGFTGSRSEMNSWQVSSLIKLLAEHEPDEFHHGCCTGSDTIAVRHAYGMGIPSIHAHPGKSAKTGEEEGYRDTKSIELSDVVHTPLGHFARNRVIVNTCDLLIATPWQSKEHEPPEGSGGGTWMTVQYAVKMGKPVKIMWPDGTVETR